MWNLSDFLSQARAELTIRCTASPPPTSITERSAGSRGAGRRTGAAHHWKTYIMANIASTPELPRTTRQVVAPLIAHAGAATRTDSTMVW